MPKGKKIVTLADGSVIEVGTRFKDLMGKSFGRLTVVRLSRVNISARWDCTCACGNTCTIGSSSLLSGKTTSCGCYNREVTSNMRRTHGLRKSKEYNNWTNMRSRCCDENNPNYPSYGGVGITVCERWKKSFTAFLEDMGRHPDTKEEWSIDRIDNSLGYFKENCRWATRETQNRNHTQRADNSSGTTGVHYSETRGAWVAQWSSLNRKRRSATYSVKKYGEELALLCAIEARDQAIRLLNQQGAGYSANHGKDQQQGKEPNDT